MFLIGCYIECKKITILFIFRGEAHLENGSYVNKENCRISDKKRNTGETTVFSIRDCVVCIFFPNEDGNCEWCSIKDNNKRIFLELDRWNRYPE